MLHKKILIPVQMIAMFAIFQMIRKRSILMFNGAPATLTGAGYVFKFAVELIDVFNDGVNPN